MKSINGSTQIYGVMGDPIEHTLSPHLHNAVFEARKVNAVYLPFNVKKEHLPIAIDGFKSLGIKGLNVTLPHKEHAVLCVDTLPNQMDKAIGAINTLVVENGQTFGFNTDGRAFLQDLKDELQVNPKGKRAMIIGAGGAARAVGFALLGAGLEKLSIYNRTHARADGLAHYLGQYFEDRQVEPVRVIDEDGSEEYDLLVNTTSCGMKDNDPFPVTPDVLNGTKAFYDVIYSPCETKMVKEAKSREIIACGGIGMLIGQAALAHHLWFPHSESGEIVRIMTEAYSTWKS